MLDAITAILMLVLFGINLAHGDWGGSCTTFAAFLGYLRLAISHP